MNISALLAAHRRKMRKIYLDNRRTKSNKRRSAPSGRGSSKIVNKSLLTDEENYNPNLPSSSNTFQTVRNFTSLTTTTPLSGITTGK